MDPSSLHTAQLKDWFSRMRAGDASARNELVRAVCDRLERLARKMLRDYPRVRAQQDTWDVLQNALMRLMRALPEVQPDSVREFFGLASLHLRRELLDLAKYYNRQGRKGELPAGALVQPGADDRTQPLDSPERRDDPDELERWSAFHEAVENLPAEEREVVSLRFYHDWTQKDIAELLQVDERTIRRYWQSACTNLHTALAGRLPSLEGQ